MRRPGEKAEKTLLEPSCADKLKSALPCLGGRFNYSCLAHLQIPPAGGPGNLAARLHKLRLQRYDEYKVMSGQDAGSIFTG